MNLEQLNGSQHVWPIHFHDFHFFTRFIIIILYRDCTHIVLFCQWNILEHKQKNIHALQKFPWLFQGWRKDGVFCDRGNPVYHIKCVHKKGKGKQIPKYQHFSPWFDIYYSYIHDSYTYRESQCLGGQSSLWNKFLRTGSLHFLCLYRHLSKHKYSNTIKA